MQFPSHHAPISRSHSLCSLFERTTDLPTVPPSHRRCHSEGEPLWYSIPIESDKDDDAAFFPGTVQPKDVVLATRGIRDSALAYPGNRRFQLLIAMRLDRYRDAASQRDKSAIAIEVERAVRDSGGRFLRFEHGRVVGVDDKRAREKIARAFRVSLRRSAKPAAMSLAQSAIIGCGSSCCTVGGDVTATSAVRRRSSASFAPLSWQRDQRASQLHRDQAELVDFLQNTFLLEAEC